MNKIWKSWKYKNITFAILGIIFALYLSQIDAFSQFLLHLGTLGYLGAFLAGALFVSTFTVTTGILILFTLAQNFHPLEIAILAGLGAVLGDLIIFHLVKDHLMGEMKSIYNNLGGKHLSKLLHTKYFNWTLPMIGAIIIASPLPDELGVSLMGIAKMKTYQFVFISFLLNAIGIFLVVSASLVIRP